eukprot:TRINITY_DN66660_c7_g6_i2.p1 TRINITY_DN66660_c7_g6~~TRINITY_DN66660_c7_g6_i2.p1  ORF type:complete len:617 (+),score=260.63 TRINITY_DN66660_c7_g6_i2:39-1853(+)
MKSFSTPSLVRSLSPFNNEGDDNDERKASEGDSDDVLDEDKDDVKALITLKRQSQRFYYHLQGAHAEPPQLDFLLPPHVRDTATPSPIRDQQRQEQQDEEQEEQEDEHDDDDDDDDDIVVSGADRDNFSRFGRSRKERRRRRRRFTTPEAFNNFKTSPYQGGSTTSSAASSVNSLSAALPPRALASGFTLAKYDSVPFRVLYIEDSATNRRVMQRVLSQYAHVDVAVNGKDGVDMFESALLRGRCYNVVLMDLVMPVMDGYDAAVRIRQILSEYRAAQAMRRAEEEEMDDDAEYGDDEQAVPSIEDALVVSAATATNEDDDEEGEDENDERKDRPSGRPQLSPLSIRSHPAIAAATGAASSGSALGSTSPSAFASSPDATSPSTGADSPSAARHRARFKGSSMHTIDERTRKLIERQMVLLSIADEDEPLDDDDDDHANNDNNNNNSKSNDNNENNKEPKTSPRTRRRMRSHRYAVIRNRARRRQGHMHRRRSLVDEYNLQHLFVPIDRGDGVLGRGCEAALSGVRLRRPVGEAAVAGAHGQDDSLVGARPHPAADGAVRHAAMLGQRERVVARVPRGPAVRRQRAGHCVFDGSASFASVGFGA